MTQFAEKPEAILARLETLRASDGPTHGGHVLANVYDSGLAELDELAASAIRMVQPVNGLDPTSFPSVAVMERDIVAFAGAMLGAEDDVVGTVTSGGTESCLLAVQTARDTWQGTGKPRLVAPVSASPAFRKAAHYFGLELDLVPIDQGGAVSVADVEARLGPEVALLVVSAPSYPHAVLDPIEAVATAAEAQGIACHVDAGIGGWVLPFWPGLDAAWDFRVPGVTSVSADLHKFGYAPKGVSVLLQRGRDRQRSQYFATAAWPGYPVVDATILGSRAAGPLAAGWAIIHALGMAGFESLALSCERSTRELAELIRSIDGLRVVGKPVGPLLAVAADNSVPVDRRVDPHHWADQARTHGWSLQHQPQFQQPNGSVLPPTAHLTITPVTEGVLPELCEALVEAADEIRGVPGFTAEFVMAALQEGLVAGLHAPLDADAALGILRQLGLAGSEGVPERTAPVMALISALPAPLTEGLLTELLARLSEPQ